MKKLFLIISLFFVSSLIANEEIKNEENNQVVKEERFDIIPNNSIEDRYKDAKKILDQEFNRFSQNLYYLNENIQDKVFMKNLISNKEDEKTFVYEIDMPGIEKKDVVIEVIDGENGKIINITGKKDFKSKELVKNRLYSFSISYPKNTNKLNASMLNGVLKLTFDKIKKDEKQARKIIEIQ